MEGREERIEQLNRMYSFPMRSLFYLHKDDDKKLSVCYSEYEDKKTRIYKIRFSDLDGYIDGGTITPLKVVDCEDAETWIAYADELREMWLD